MKLLKKITKAFSVLFLSSLLFNVTGCQVDAGSSDTTEPNKEQPENPDNPNNPDNPGTNDPGSGKTTPAEPTLIADSFFWGTWVRMDNGRTYKIGEKYLTYDYDRYPLKAESRDSVTYETLGTFTKASDSVIINGNIPYFRNGGSNLDYSLKIVGFTNSRAVSSGVKGLKGIGKSKNYESFKSEGESDAEGLLKLKAPTINDVQTVTLDLNDGTGSLITIPDIIVSNKGDYMGTVALVDKDQYNLKISGYISNRDNCTDRDNGYLFGNNENRYEMELTITNISNVECKSSSIEIIPADPRLKIYSEDNLEYGLDLQTIAPKAYQKINLEIEFGDMPQNEPFINTGLNIRITNITDEVWEDYVPLRFYRGLIPITIATKSPSKNSTSKLNGFVIYPDGNNQYFSIDNNSSMILLVPTFGKDEKYKMVFSGAETAQNADEGTEMYYSVVPGKSTEKEINLNTEVSVRNEWKKHGEPNNNEEDEFYAENEFIAYLASGDIDYYTISADSDEIYPPDPYNHGFIRVNFESEYGTVPESILVYWGTAIPSSKMPVPEAEGMEFLGWYDGYSLVTADTTSIFSSNEEKTLTAKWKVADYSVEYVLNGGAAGSVDEAKNDSSNPASYTINSSEITLKAPSRTGYDFKNWYLSSDFSGEPVTKIAGGKTGNLKLYAKWDAKSYKINYVLNGGEAGSEDEAKNHSENPETYTIEETFSLKPATRQGYAFMGWYKNSSLSGDTVSSIHKGTTGEITLYAKWLEECKVTYTSEHGTLPSTLAAGIIKGKTSTFNEEELPSLSEEGWLFKGWYATSSGTGDGQKAEAGVYVIQGDITLTAKWAVACKITYSSDKALSDIPETKILEAGTILTANDLPDLKEKGFTFKGWFIDDTKIIAGTVINKTITLTAKWEEGIDDGFVLVKSGSFQMGKSADDNDVTPVHTVTVSDFYISPYEVTQGEYEELCFYCDGSSGTHYPTSTYGKGTNYPAYYVKWYDALVFCNLKSMKEGLTPCYAISGTTDPKKWTGISKSNTGKYACDYASDNQTWNSVTCDFSADGYRLPTEAEWEYAAKGGNKSEGYIYSGSNNIDEVAWNMTSSSHAVGTKTKNELNLYDMSGNIAEWCWDWYTDTYNSENAVDPTGPSSGSSRVKRGGDFQNNTRLRVTYRECGAPCVPVYNTGFRLVRSGKTRLEKCTVTYTTSHCTAPASGAVLKGSTLTAEDLPELTYEDYDFEGWYDGNTKIEAGYVVESKLELTAKWTFNDNFVLVKGGTFQMGKSADGKNITPVVHSVTVSDFYISPYELTQGRYEELCCYRSGGTSAPNTTYRAGINYPVYYVSWYDALVYCNLKSMKEGFTPCYTISGSKDPKDWPGIQKGYGKYCCNYTTTNDVWDAVTCDFSADGYRLPTEAEWEYAAKGGNKTAGYTYSGSNDIDKIAWYTVNSETKNHEVGTKEKNELDLFDMTGNVAEWCWDWFENYNSENAIDPTGPSSGTYRVRRGGSFNYGVSSLSTTTRDNTYALNRSKDLGFRLVRSSNTRLGKCTVSYSTSHGTAPAGTTLAKGSALTETNLPSISSDNYDFIGWFTGSTKVEKGFIVNSDTELEAHWNPTSYKIIYVLNGGASGSADEAFNNSENPATYTIEDSILLKAASRNGYKFAGWYKNSSFTGNAVTSIEKGNSGKITLYANWIELCTISYSSEKGVVPETISVEKGSILTDNELPKLKATGFRMTGWFSEGTKIKAGNTINTNLNLTAQWEEHDGPDDDFVFVKNGTFQMGNSADGNNSTPVHGVTVSDFYISPYELTQGEYEELCCYTSNAPGSGAQYPVYNVSWYDALVYCNLRSMKEGLTPCYTMNGETDPKNWPGIKTSSGKYSCSYGSSDSTWDKVSCDFTANGYRLPTEAEWEFAAKGGNKSLNYNYSGSNTANEAGWYNGNSGSTIHEVGTKNENELDLYDMSGNVSEWCWDWYGNYSTGSAINPKGALSGTSRVLRGGSWLYEATYLRVANRYSVGSSNRSAFIGFRLVRSAVSNGN